MTDHTEDQDEPTRFGVTIVHEPVPVSFLATVPEGKRWVFQRELEDDDD